MASIQDVITERLATFSIEISPVRLESLLIDSDLTGTDTYSKDKMPAVKSALLSVLSELLAMPDVTEGGLTLKWDRTAVQAYCDQLRTELGLTQSDGAVINDLSSLW